MTNTFIITGDTYTSREELKALGGSWVPHLKAWLVPEYHANAVRRLQKRLWCSVSLVDVPCPKTPPRFSSPNAPA